MDTRATAHLHSDPSILKSFTNKCTNFSVLVGDGSRIPVTQSGNSSSSLHRFCTLALNNVLITPQIIKNLVYVRKFTCNNKCSIEYDEFGFSMKNLLLLDLPPVIPLPQKVSRTFFFQFIKLPKPMLRSAPSHTHPMATRSRHGIVKPITNLNLHTESHSESSSMPRNYSQAFQDPN